MVLPRQFNTFRIPSHCQSLISVCKDSFHISKYIKFQGNPYVSDNLGPNSRGGHVRYQGNSKTKNEYSQSLTIFNIATPSWGDCHPNTKSKVTPHILGRVEHTTNTQKHLMPSLPLHSAA